MFKFEPIGASSCELSMGWVPPRGIEHGAMLETVSGFSVAMVAIEKKTVPASEVKKLVAEMAAQIEEQTGRKPGKKERKELKEDAITQLLPKAFPKRTDVPVLISPTGNVFIGTTSQAAREGVLVALSVASVQMQSVQTHQSVSGLMAGLVLNDELETTFLIGRECELVASDETNAKVSFKNHRLDPEEIRDHVESGKVFTKLALCDARDTDFVLTDKLVLKKLKFAAPEADGPKEDAFDADVVLQGSALDALANDLIEALGGLVEVEEAAE